METIQDNLNLDEGQSEQRIELGRPRNITLKTLLSYGKHSGDPCHQTLMYVDHLSISVHVTEQICCSFQRQLIEGPVLYPYD